MDLKEKLESMSRDELNQLAKKSSLAGFRKLKIDELRSELLGNNEASKLLKNGNKKNHSVHLYGVVGILLGIGSVAATYYYANIGTLNSDPFKLAKDYEVKRYVERLLSKKTHIITKPNSSRKPVKNIVREENINYETIEKTLVWDLRKWRRLHSIDLSKPNSPVTAMIRTKVKKISLSDNYNKMSMTSGYDVYTQCIEPNRKCEISAGVKRITTGGNILKARSVSINTSTIPINKEFDIVTKSTYWNAFQNKDQSWIGVAVRDRIAKVSMLVILPDKKLFENFNLSVAEINSDKKFIFSGEQLILGDPSRRYIYWEMLNPNPDHVYRIDWEW